MSAIEHVLDKKPPVSVRDFGGRTSKDKLGYCNCNAHKGFLALKQIQEHMCLEKNCPFLQKMEHEYWNRLKGEKARSRRLRKEKYARLAREQRVLQTVRDIAANYPYIYPTTARFRGRLLQVTYIYERRVDLIDFIEELRREFQCGVYIKGVPTAYETKARQIPSMVDSPA